MQPRVVIAGGTGFMGQSLCAHLVSLGYQVVVLTRHHRVDKDGIRYVQWDGRTLGAWTDHLEGAKAIINLCGRSVNCRYTEKNKQAIYNSRIIPTQTIGKAIANSHNAPEVWINASTATYYRHAEDRPMTEREGERGTGFSVDVATKWEESFYHFDLPHTRRIALRTSIVFGREGGAFPVLVRLARLGLGGKQGNGRQMVSWIHILDFCRAVVFLMECKSAEGGYNIASPNPLTNASLMQKLANAYGPGWGLPAPVFLLEAGAAVIGTETELILKSRWVIPERLLKAGFTFDISHIDAAIPELKRKRETKKRQAAVKRPA